MSISRFRCSPWIRGHLCALLCLAGTLVTAAAGAQERIKDLASVYGVRSNHLTGYGLVVGLDGTGDQLTQAPFTGQSLRNMLGQLGVAVPAGLNIQVGNVAAVMVQAELPPFAKEGQTIDITVSSIGNASSLRGGSLLLTQLFAVDGGVYALAQGNLVVGGFGAQGGDGSRISVNVPTAGRVPGGAVVEQHVETSFYEEEMVVLNLNRADFTTARNMAEAINDIFGAETATPLDAVSVGVIAPADNYQRVEFISMLENIDVVTAQPAARVVINARTGTIVMGGTVRVLPAAVAHGSLTVTITENFDVSQPQAFGRGETVVTPRSDIEAEFDEDASRMFPFGPGSTLDEIVRAVNDVGAAPGDLVAILEALHQAGALRASLIVI